MRTDFNEQLTVEQKTKYYTCLQAHSSMFSYCFDTGKNLSFVGT